MYEITATKSVVVLQGNASAGARCHTSREALQAAVVVSFCRHILSVTLITYEEINRILADFSGEHYLENSEKLSDIFFYIPQ